MGKKRGAYWVLVGKPERKTPLGRLSRRWENNIKVDLTETEWEASTGLIRLWRETVASSYEYGNDASGSIKFGKFLA
jgi:hypothetical protein